MLKHINTHRRPKTPQHLIALLIGICLWPLACQTTKQSEQDLSKRCCQECLEAFSQSPVAVGAEGANCGAFTTAKPLSSACSNYFMEHPQTVAGCE